MWRKIDLGREEGRGGKTFFSRFYFFIFQQILFFISLGRCSYIHIIILIGVPAHKKYKRNIITCSLVCSRVKASSSSFFLRCSLSFLILSIKASCSCSEMFEKQAPFLKQGLLSCVAKYPHQVPRYVKLLLYMLLYIYTQSHFTCTRSGYY